MTIHGCIHMQVFHLLLKENNEHRIFFPRCANNISRVGWLDINLDNPKLILDISKRPYIEEGKLAPTVIQVLCLHGYYLIIQPISITFSL